MSTYTHTPASVHIRMNSYKSIAYMISRPVSVATQNPDIDSLANKVNNISKTVVVFVSVQSPVCNLPWRRYYFASEGKCVGV